MRSQLNFDTSYRKGIASMNHIQQILESLGKTVSPWVVGHTKTVIQEYFGSNLLRAIPLAGGYGSATNILLESSDKFYVLRVLGKLELPIRRTSEIFALKQASAAGVAPTILWTSPDEFAILMNYISGGTLTIEKSKGHEVIAKIANQMRKVHALPKNPFHAPFFETQMIEHYEVYSQQDLNKTIWEDAITIIKEGSQHLRELNAPLVNTHGDLNPRNILVSDHEVYFVDWGDGTFSDPFQDVAFYSISMNYDAKGEEYLLQRYLGHTPTSVERQRFKIAKRMNFARLVLSGQGIGNDLAAKYNLKNTLSDSPREWSYYTKTFADDNDHLSAEFFWGQARLALELAKR